MRAKTLGIEVEVVHNASIMNAVGACGLQLYRFGEAISIPFFTDTWRPDSFYDKIKANRTIGLHTLCLLGMLRYYINHCSLHLSNLLHLIFYRKLRHSIHSSHIECNVRVLGLFLYSK